MGVCSGHVMPACLPLLTASMLLVLLVLLIGADKCDVLCALALVVVGMSLYDAFGVCVVGARGYLCLQNHFPSLLRTSTVIMQAPIVSHVNLMAIQDLAIHIQLVHS